MARADFGFRWPGIPIQQRLGAHATCPGCRSRSGRHRGPGMTPATGAACRPAPAPRRSRPRAHQSAGRAPGRSSPARRRAERCRRRTRRFRSRTWCRSGPGRRAAPPAACGWRESRSLRTRPLMVVVMEHPAAGRAVPLRAAVAARPARWGQRALPAQARTSSAEASATHCLQRPPHQHRDHRLLVFGGPAPAGGLDHLLGDLLPGSGEQLRPRLLPDEHLLGCGSPAARSGRPRRARCAPR